MHALVAFYIIKRIIRKYVFPCFPHSFLYVVVGSYVISHLFSFRKEYNLLNYIRENMREA